MPVYTQQQIYEAALQVGFPPQSAQIIAAIALAEAPARDAYGNVIGADTDATNPVGEYSVGPLQINLNAHGDKISESQARDLYGALQYALQLSKGGADFSDWTTFTGWTPQGYTTPKYLQYMQGGGGTGMPAGQTTQGWEPVYVGGQLVGYQDNRPFSEGGTGRFIRADEVGGSAYPIESKRYGYTAPDFIQAAQAALRKYLAEIEATGESADIAYKKWQTEFDPIKTQLETQLGIQQEVGRRAGTLARDILPNVVPEGFSFNIPGMGDVGQMATPVDVGKLLDMGTGGLASVDVGALQGISKFPDLTMPQAPDIGPILQQAMQGFPGFNFTPSVSFVNPPNAGALPGITGAGPAQVPSWNPPDNWWEGAPF